MSTEVTEITNARVTRENSEKDERETRRRMMDMLQAASGQLTTDSTGVAYHPVAADAPLVSIREDASPAKATKFLASYTAAQAAESVFQLPPEIKCRPWDGAVNLNDLLKKIYGMASQGLAVPTMFGTRPPQEITVEVGYKKHVSVPFGLIDFPDFEGELYMGSKVDPDYGLLFDAYIKCPRKHKGAVDGFWKLLGDHIQEHSIYKGQAIVGVGKLDREGNFEHPHFLDVNAIDPAKVAYRREVFERLNSSVWGPIETAYLQRKLGRKLNRKTLLFGAYGTGKTLAGGLTARVAVANGWTMIQAKTGDEDLNTVLRTAEMLAPAVVFIEDVDILMKSDPAKMAELLEQFDGVSSKNKEVMVLMTSNHVNTLSKGMTRVGRIDAAIEIGSLDREATERLISAMFAPEMLSEGIDWDSIYRAMEGYEPAFIMGTFELTLSNAIIRTRSDVFTLSTEDFVLAAETLRNQHDTHTNAADRPAADLFGEALGRVVEQASAKSLQSHRVDFRENGDIITVS